MQTKRFLSAFWALAQPYWVPERRAKGLAQYHPRRLGWEGSALVAV